MVQSNWFTQLAINKDGPKTSLELMQWNNVPEIDYQFSVCVLLTISNEGQLVC